MKITVINGTEKYGVTYKLKELVIMPFRDKAEITEFFLPTDCPRFCAGCMTCFLKDEHKCKDAQYTQIIEEAMLDADLLVFTSPAYVFHTTGAMKTMLDHFGYRWMPHRPAKEMFGKRAVIITQCLGAGNKSAAKDIRDSLSWWGISSIKQCRLRLMSDVFWDKLPDKKRSALVADVQKAVDKILNIDYSKPARTGFVTKCKFYMVRFIQKKVGKTNPSSVDYQYWKSNGWLDNKRPWK